MVKPSRKRKRKDKKHKRKKDENPEHVKAPHTFVFAKGHVGRKCNQLALDMRKVMEPFTATNLKVGKRNVLKDFVAVASPLGVSHLLVFTKTDKSIHLRLIRVPRGPTLHFKVKGYSLRKDVESSLKRPKVSLGQFTQAPLLILNGFQKLANSSSSDEVDNPKKLCATMIQNMLPSLNIHKVSLNGVQRCALFNYVPETGLIEFRHYNITVKPVGASRRAKKLAGERSIPNLGKYKDISDYMLAAGDGSASESDWEVEDPNNELELPQKKAKVKKQLNAVRLTELGPRLTLELYKIEEGLCAGEVLFNSNVTKTEEEKQALRDMLHKKEKLKIKRKAIQEENVKRKQMKKK